MKYHLSLDIDFRRNTFPGTYIAIEGIDGSGKSTQIGRIQAFLKQKKKNVVITSEPTRTTIVGKLIHDILQSKIKVPSPALQYLYSADRVINHQTTVEPALQAGDIVLSHRVFWSAIPYGVMDKIIDMNHGSYDFNQSNQIIIAQGILSMYHQFIVPDITFYLDISIETALDRLSHMDKTKEIYEKRDKLEKIRQGYKMLIDMFPQEFTSINGEKSEEAITQEILKNVESRMKGTYK